MELLITFVSHSKNKVMEVTQFTDTQNDIIKKIALIVSILGGNSGVVAPIASWGDTLSDEAVLEQLQQMEGKRIATCREINHSTRLDIIAVVCRDAAGFVAPSLSMKKQITEIENYIITGQFDVDSNQK